MFLQFLYNLQIDLSLESGEYFLTEDQRKSRAQSEKTSQQQINKLKKKHERALEFQAPSV